jgi:hypothetical protein
MTKQLMFYSNVVPINAERHGDLYVRSGKDFRFAAEADAVPLTLAEFPAAALEYVIAFAGNDEGVTPIAMLAPAGKGNLFLDGEGQWQGRYIPAFVRRYPFVFSRVPDSDQLALCIDEEYEGCNREGRGERLFDSDGEQTSWLKGVMEFHKAYQIQNLRTQAFCKQLKELDLLQTLRVTLSGKEGEQPIVTGIRAINREKFKGLDPKLVQEWFANDWLEMIHLHFHSMNHLQGLGKRLQEQAVGEGGS